MKLLLAFTALLAVSGCATLTGDQFADCLAARNAVLTAQGSVTATEAYATHHPGKDADQAISFAKAYLASALATQASVCPAN